MSAPANVTVEQALSMVREVGDEKELIYPIYVLDPASQRLLRSDFPTPTRAE